MQENMEMFVEVVALFNGHVGNNINPKIYELHDSSIYMMRSHK
jgi:hypothetical protein